MHELPRRVVRQKPSFREPNTPEAEFQRILFLGALTYRRPLEVHLSRIFGQQGVEPKLGRFSILKLVPAHLLLHNNYARLLLGGWRAKLRRGCA